MKCAVCSHHWCWTCGLDYYSRFHGFIGVRLLCETIGKISFREFGKCTKILLLLLLIIFFPLLFAIFCLLLAADLVDELLTRCGASKMYYIISSCLSESNLLARIRGLFLCMLLLPVWLAITLTLGGLLFAVSIVPAYIVLVFLLCRKFYIWNRGR